ncbi:DUF488 domain-containing protein [Fluoribacter dumoffii]|uniref:Uncharacterized conserved protein n=1 Tax=Fluoribacter dumoffii TaxID=463 RepID=A0A377ITK8_9GAMM|nr:DUF488 family protein [Fluoribacter dumoffii]STO91536.1 Uncharacterized conserved protein [Fluoribacter dumoffii]STO91783.1 Uncharacterized conserved protein [Fluoribacter dumoffii]
MSSTHRNTIQICRVYAPPPIKEGAWILIDRLWPRGLKKETLAFDLWLKDITPSVALRQWFHGILKSDGANLLIAILKN